MDVHVHHVKSTGTAGQTTAFTGCAIYSCGIYSCTTLVPPYIQLYSEHAIADTVSESLFGTVRVPCPNQVVQLERSIWAANSADASRHISSLKPISASVFTKWPFISC